jgi:hypothetical protein
MPRASGAQIRDLDALGWVPDLRPDQVRACVRDDKIFSDDLRPDPPLARGQASLGLRPE